VGVEDLKDWKNGWGKNCLWLVGSSLFIIGRVERPLQNAQGVDRPTGKPLRSLSHCAYDVCRNSLLSPNQRAVLQLNSTERSSPT
jgi:hypothetical protein